MRHLVRLSLLFCLAACSHNVPPSGASASHEPRPSAREPDPAVYDHLVIIGTNDFHGYLRPVESDVGTATVRQGGAEWFAGYVDILSRP
uniref:hypothetical protein n=1 Tax=Staphylococcus epidermidis TaxID=1282 RepID=UPI002739C7F1